MSGEEIQNIFCDPAQITQYFDLHGAINPEEFSSTFCGINGTMFVDEFIETFSISSLIDQMNTGSGKLKYS